MGDWWQTESLIKFESPTSIFIVGPSGSGKTVLVKNMLTKADGIFKIPPVQIYFCYSVWQPIYDEMKQHIVNIHFVKGLPSMDELNDWGSNKEHKIICFDDMMMEMCDREELSHMFCVGSHHFNFTVIHILQNVFQKGKAMRSASLSCHYFILFSTKRDVLQIQTLGRQIFPGKVKYFIDAYTKATLLPHSYLLVD